MDFLTLFMLALALSMDAFAVSVSNSMCFSDLSKKQAVLTSVTFGLFQGGMPVIGYLAGRGFSNFISKVDHWMALVLLGFIGGKMLYEGIRALKEPESCPAQSTLNTKMMLTQGVATSIDALAVGISLAALNVNIFAAASFIGVITLSCCLVGHFIGKKAGGALGKKAEIMGGVILLAIGIKIFVEHMFF